MSTTHAVERIVNSEGRRGKKEREEEARRVDQDRLHSPQEVSRVPHVHEALALFVDSRTGPATHPALALAVRDGARDAAVNAAREGAQPLVEDAERDDNEERGDEGRVRADVPLREDDAGVDNLRVPARLLLFRWYVSGTFE